MGNKNYQNHRKSGIIRTDGVAPKKHLGQHFLKDENVAKRIGETLSMQGYDCVLEIGPGTGVLTKYLLGKGKHILAMELDPESVAFLQESFRTAQSEALKREGGFTVVQADFLKANLHQLFDGAPFAITGNFPYNISSQIVFKAIENRHLIPEFSGMFQKEVAQRICASEGSKTYGILSVLTQVYYEATYLFTVPPEVFNPPPKVVSGVIRLVRKEQLQLPCDEKLLIQVVKTAFQQRRKTLRNSLKGLDLPPDLKEDSIFDKRPEQLSVQSFMDLTGLIERSRSASE